MHIGTKAYSDYFRQCGNIWLGWSKSKIQQCKRLQLSFSTRCLFPPSVQAWSAHSFLPKQSLISRLWRTYPETKRLQCTRVSESFEILHIHLENLPTDPFSANRNFSGPIRLFFKRTCTMCPLDIWNIMSTFSCIYMLLHYTQHVTRKTRDIPIASIVGCTLLKY